MSCMGLPHGISKSSNFDISKFDIKNRQTHDRNNSNNNVYVPTGKISPKGLMGWLSKRSNVVSLKALESRKCSAVRRSP